MTTEVGVYGQVAGLGVSAGVGGDEFVNIQVFAQASVGAAGVAGIGISFDPFDLFDGDPNTRVFDFPSTLAVGVGTPPGTPVSALAVRDVRTGAITTAVGVGAADIAEIGGYSVNSSPEASSLNVDRLRYQMEFRSSDARDSVAREATASDNRVNAADNDPLGVNSDPNVEYYEYQDRQSGAQVRTKVVVDPVTGQKRAVYSTVIDSNPEQSDLKGNTYPPGKVQAGYELNALDRISEERNIWKNTPDPRPTGPQGSGAGPSDPNDPRGAWQIPGAPGDRTGGGTSRSGGSEGGNAQREGAGGGRPTGDSAADRAADRAGSGGGGNTSSGPAGGPPPGGGGGNTSSGPAGGPPPGGGGGNKPSGPAGGPPPGPKPSPKPYEPPKYGPQPVLLDLDGNGIKITEYQNSTQFMTGKDGLQHRSSWAGAGDGVLFYDPDGRNAITEARQYVFTEWNPTAAGDLEALRSVWDTNGDGKLSAADAEFAKFKVMVTNADGSTSVMTLAAAGDHRDQPDGQYGEHRAAGWLGDHRADDVHSRERDDGDGGEYDAYGRCGGVSGGGERGHQRGW